MSSHLPPYLPPRAKRVTGPFGIVALRAFDEGKEIPTGNPFALSIHNHRNGRHPHPELSASTCPVCHRTFVTRLGDRESP